MSAASLLVDRLNLRLGWSSLWRNWIAGCLGRIAAFLWSRAFCARQGGLDELCNRYQVPLQCAFRAGAVGVRVAPAGLFLVLPSFALQPCATYVYAACSPLSIACAASVASLAGGGQPVGLP